MSAASNQEELLNELLGEAEPETDEPEEAAADAGDDAPEQDDSSHPAEGPAEVEPENDARSAPSEDDDAAPAPSAGTDQDDEEEESPEKRRADALQREVTRLRSELRAAKAQQQAQYAPPPTAPQGQAPQAPPEPKKPKGVPVVVSEDGQHVYVDPDLLGQTVEERARALIEEARKPTPEQIAAYELQSMASEFVSADPERNQRALEVANQADDFISLALQNVIATQGVRPSNAFEAARLAREVGIDQQVAEYFPEVAPLFDEFVQAFASNQVGWKRSVLERIAAQGGQSIPVQTGAKPQSGRPLTPVTGTPRSLARKGGSRSDSPVVEENEFKSLEAEFYADPTGVQGFSQDKYRRLEELGRKLQKPGWV